MKQEKRKGGTVIRRRLNYCSVFSLQKFGISITTFLFREFKVKLR